MAESVTNAKLQEMAEELIRSVRESVLEDLRNDPGTTLFGRPLPELKRLICEEEERKALSKLVGKMRFTPDKGARP